MPFCPKCGAICMPKKEGDKVIFKCSCGHSQEGYGKITEKVDNKHHEVRIAEQDHDVRPIVKTKCPKCAHNEGHNWEIQTRAGDEPATQFFKCTKCKHTWREYK